MNKTKILICGICGKMGTNVLSLLDEDETAEAVCGVDPFAKTLSVPVYKSFSEVTETVGVVIDFSSAENLKERLDFAKQRKIGIVLGSTGFTEEDNALVDEYAKEIPVFKTANLSLGVNLMQALVKAAASVLGEKFDVEIVERHHNLKKDAPSGTALMLADSINEVFDGQKRYTEGRSGIVGAREKAEIGIHAVRGGTIVGEHEVMFAGEDEILTVSHSARSKRVFAAGAIRAAKFLKGKAPGKYEMKDLLNENKN